MDDRRARPPENANISPVTVRGHRLLLGPERTEAIMRSGRSAGTLGRSRALSRRRGRYVGSDTDAGIRCPLRHTCPLGTPGREDADRKWLIRDAECDARAHQARELFPRVRGGDGERRRGCRGCSRVALQIEAVAVHARYGRGEGVDRTHRLDPSITDHDVRVVPITSGRRGATGPGRRCGRGSRAAPCGDHQHGKARSGGT